MVPTIHDDHPFKEISSTKGWDFLLAATGCGWKHFESLGSIACEPFRDKLWLQHVTTRKEKMRSIILKSRWYVYTYTIIYIIYANRICMCSCDPKRPDMNPEVFPNNLSVSRGIFSRNHLGVSENRLCPQRAILIYGKWWIIPKNFGRYPPINWHRCGKPTMKWSCSKQKTMGLHILYP